jgi:uncharacterized protein YbjT (DUF2867 family)
MKETIFVTGATGNVGREVVKHLLQGGCKVIASRLPHEKTEDSENLKYVIFDFTDPNTWDPCLEGVSKLFLMRPPHIAKIKRDMYPFLKYIKDKGINQVVFLSVQGVEKNKIVPHRKVEDFVRELEIPYTFVRPSFFMQKLTTTHLSEIRDERMVFVPTGKGRTNFIDVRDIGEVMARMFFDKKHINQAYTITGEISYSYKEVAEHLTKGLGRDILFINPNPISFVSHHLKKGRALAMTLVMLALYSVVKSGNGDISTSTSQEILGRKTRSLDEFIEDHKSLLTGQEEV